MLWQMFRSLVPDPIKRKLRKLIWMRLNPSWTLRSRLVVRVLSYSDWIIYNDIFVDGEYDQAIDALIQASAASTRTSRVLDLGGNVGFFTLRLADSFLRNGQENFSVILVEGSPATFSELRERLAANENLGDRVRAINGLVGHRSGVGEISGGESHGENTLFHTSGRRTEVPFVDLDDLVRSWDRVDLLKCDIEGAEELFLGNYSALLKRTERAVLEFHHDKCDVTRCRRLLADAGLEKELTLREFGCCSVELFRRES